MNLPVRIAVPVALVSLLALTASPAAGASPADAALGNINHIVVIYQENHSFDNLYGSWERVNGLGRAEGAHTTQIGQGGVPYTCLKQNEPLLAAAQPQDCIDSTTGTTFASHFPNAPFTIDGYIPSTVPTEDLVHRYYQEQYQLNGGNQNRYVTGSDAIGLTMGQYNTQLLPIYQYLHMAGHPQYAIADKFFQASFGGSFLNHQWLVAAATPVFAGALNDGSSDDRHSVVDANGMPANPPLYQSPLGAAVKDFNLTASCHPAATRPRTPTGVVCGDFAVNTTQPIYQPYFPGTPEARRLPALAVTPGSTANVTIGDELNSAHVDWAWYSGGWDNAAGNTKSQDYTNGPGPTCADPNHLPSDTYPYCADKLFQFHHQPFNYFASFAPGTRARRDHLRDEAEFLRKASTSTTQCKLKPVSFVKPIGEENEHPGYTNEAQGSQHLVDLIKAIEGSACKKDTLVVATYDEFGGQWDHVTPPGQGGSGGVADQWGPGTRIPALVISPNLNGDFVVDHVAHDTTSILTTIEHRFGLAPLGTRDAAVRDLSSVYMAH